MATFQQLVLLQDGSCLTHHIIYHKTNLILLQNHVFFVRKVHSIVNCKVANTMHFSDKKQRERERERDRQRQRQRDRDREEITHHLLLFFGICFKYGCNLRCLNQNHSLRWRSLWFTMSNGFDRFITIGPTLLCLRSIRRDILILFRRAYSFLGKPKRYFFIYVPKLYILQGSIHLDEILVHICNIQRVKLAKKC